MIFLKEAAPSSISFRPHNTWLSPRVGAVAIETECGVRRKCGHALCPGGGQPLAQVPGMVHEEERIWFDNKLNEHAESEMSVGYPRRGPGERSVSLGTGKERKRKGRRGREGSQGERENTRTENQSLKLPSLYSSTFYGPGRVTCWHPTMNTFFTVFFPPPPTFFSFRFFFFPLCFS